MAVRAIFPYLGNKRRHIDIIRKYLPQDWKNGTYIEPFVGSGVIFQSLKPSRAILNDSSSYVTSVYECLQNDTDHFLAVLQEIYDSHSPETHSFYRNSLMMETDVFKKAAMYDYLLRTSTYSYVLPPGHGSTFRCTFKNGINKPRITRALWEDMAKCLKSHNTQVKTTDFQFIMQSATKGDFLVLDPPYIASGQKAFSFTKEDNDRFLVQLQLAHKRGVNIMMFNHKNYICSQNIFSQKISIVNNKNGNSKFNNYKETMFLNY